MTTQIPTSNAGFGGFDAGSLPPCAPDPALLAKLAGAFFSALPGQASPAAAASIAPTPLALGGNPAPVNVLPAGAPTHPFVAGPANPAGYVPGANVAPTSPQSVLSLGTSVPSLVPHAVAGNGVPDHALVAAPAQDGRVGGVALGVPEAYAASLPSTSGTSHQPVRDPRSAPYYFLGETSAYGSPPDHRTDTGVPAFAAASPSTSPALPETDDLRGLLTTNAASPASAPARAAPSANSTGFYFVDPARNPHSQGHHAGGAPNVTASARPPFDVNAIRRDFPILAERVNGRPLVWFDNAATTQKPRAVIDRLSYFYEHENSNIHRAAHELAARATDAYESARNKVARFIGASSADEVIFVRGATEAINLIAKSWGTKNIGEGDEIIVSHLEHHANIVPWQQLAAEKGAKIRVIPVDDTGQVILSEYERLLNPRTKIVAVTQVSNALGTVVPVKEIIDGAHRAGAVVLVDGAQSVSHLRVNVQALDADFFVFSGHKVFGPTGIGVVYGKRALLEDMPPWQGGGNMIADVTFERTVFHGPPARFEVGTGNIADAVGLGAAIDYVERIGIENIARYEHDLLAYATHAIKDIPGLRLIGTAQNKASVLWFVLANHKPEDVGRALNEEGIAVRSGHHCAQPILRRFGVEASVRPSLAFYNTCEEVDRLAAVVRRLSGR